MQVGILPTDTFPAFVCDVENRDACERLYDIKRISHKKPLSILCRSFHDVVRALRSTIIPLCQAHTCASAVPKASSCCPPVLTTGCLAAEYAI